MAAAAELVERLAQRLIARGERLALAESCTGGLIAKLCTDLAGSSAWFERGLVTYSNDAKRELLDVPPAVLRDDGAVSRRCVEAMVAGIVARTPADWAAAVTGIAGPGGGSPDKPVGSVWIGCAHRCGPVQSRLHRFDGERAAVREQSALALLEMLVAGIDAA